MPRCREPVERLLVGLALAIPGACMTMGSQPDERANAEGVRAAERERLRALVDANMRVADSRHSPEFVVVNPVGRALTREEYLASVASGDSDYLTWEPGTIEVRLERRSAAIRYLSHVEMTVRGRRLPRMEAWNIGVYEYRGGRWQIVWFQVTELAPPGDAANNRMYFRVR